MPTRETIIAIVNKTQALAKSNPAQYTFLIDALVDNIFNKDIHNYGEVFNAIKFVSATQGKEYNLYGDLMNYFLDNFMIPTTMNDSYWSTLTWPFSMLFRESIEEHDCQIYIYTENMIIYCNFARGDNEFILIPKNYTTPIHSLFGEKN
jgi:hypothetical protein